jgi:GntR family transcriptional regulator/MocR family aminotransferase
LGYIVAPRPLIAELRVLRHAMVRHPSAFLQHAFAHFLSLGHHETHARRVNQALQARMQALSEALRRELPDFQFVLPTGGASVWVRTPDWVDTSELALMAREQGVLIEAGEVFFMHPPYPCPYFRLRLSSIGVDQIGPGIRALALAVQALAQARGVPRVLAHRY